MSGLLVALCGRMKGALPLHPCMLPLVGERLACSALWQDKASSDAASMHAAVGG